MSSLASSPAARSERHFDSVTFSKEFELLLACCCVDQGCSREVSACSAAAVDWEQVVGLAEHHGVMPLLYQSVRGLSRSVPAGFLEGLRRRYENNARRNLKFAAELFRILDSLDAHGIASIPYKGPELAERAYGDLALRSFSDLDILVRRSDVVRAKTVVEELGYAPNLSLTNAEERVYLATGYEYSFDGAAGRNLLELQWDIVPRFYGVDFDCEEFFERAVSARVSGRTVRALSPEDLLLCLCVHAAKHAWIRLCWLRDIAGVLQSQVLDWNVIEERAARIGIRRMLYVSLLLAHDLLQAKLPDRVREKLRHDRAVERLCKEVTQHLSNGEEDNPECSSGRAGTRASPFLAYFWLMIRLRERVADKVCFLARLIFTPSLGEWRLVHLPESLFFLYRIVRLARLLTRIFLPSHARYETADMTTEELWRSEKVEFERKA